jgi:hypothetical protein
MAETLNEQEQLIADLLEEAHGLRMKYEEFSLYTESKVAEFVIARKALTEERDRAVHHRGLAEMMLEIGRFYRTAATVPGACLRTLVSPSCTTR